MADKKVTQLTALTAPANTDLLLVIDDPAGSPVSKKITIEDLFGATTGLTVADVDITSTSGIALTGNAVTVSSTGTRLTVTQGVIINGSGADSDTRIASDNNANMVYVDASADAVGIGTNTPTEALDINSDAIRIRTAQTPASGNNTAVGWGVGTIAWDASYLYIAANSTNIVRIPLSAF